MKRLLFASSLLILPILFCVSCKRGPKLLWTFQTGTSVFASVSIADNLVIVPGYDSFLYGVDLKTGKQVWKQSLGQRIWSKPLVQSGYIYVGSGDGYFFCVEAASGKIRWKYKTGDFIHYDPCGDTDAVYFGSQDGHFYKLSKNGKKIWDYKTGFYVWSNCAFYKNLVLATSWDTHFYAFDRSNGNVVWKVSSGLFNYGGPELAGDTVFFATHNHLYKLDAQTGRILFHRKMKYLDHTLVFDHFLWTSERGLTKRTLDGEPLGEIEFNTSATFHPVAVRDYLLVSGLNYLYAVSKDLKILWKFKAEGEDGFWSPGELKGDVYYIGNADGKVYALRLPA